MTNDPPAESDDTPNTFTSIFDAHNRLRAVQSPEGQVTTYFYDAEGRRIDPESNGPDAPAAPPDDTPDEPHIVG